MLWPWFSSQPMDSKQWWCCTPNATMFNVDFVCKEQVSVPQSWTVIAVNRSEILWVVGSSDFATEFANRWAEQYQESTAEICGTRDVGIVLFWVPGQTRTWTPTCKARGCSKSKTVLVVMCLLTDMALMEWILRRRAPVCRQCPLKVGCINENFYERSVETWEIIRRNAYFGQSKGVAKLQFSFA